MAEGFTPVGNTGNPVQGPNVLQSLSGILGLAQQKQSLGIQAQELQQQELKTKAQTEYSNFLSGFDPSKYIGPDGTLDANGVRTSSEYKGLSLAKPLVDQYVQQVQAGQLQNKQALQTLDNDTLNQMTRGIGAIAGDPDVVKDTPAGRQKVTDFYRSFAQQSPEAARISGLYGQVVRHAKQGDLGDAVYAQQLMGADVLGQRTQQQPQPTTNAAGQIINRMPRTGTLSPAPTAAATPGGSAGPTPSLGLNPPTPVVAGASARQTATGNADVDRANEVGGVQQQSSAALELTKQIDRLAEDINSGKVAKMISETGNYLGMSSVNQARSQLDKDLGQVKGLAIARAGSDSRAATILEGYPTDTTPKDTIHAAMDYIRGTARQNLARGALLSKYQASDPQGMRGFQAADNIVTNQTDPLMHEFTSLKPGERAGFYKRNFGSAEEAQAFKDRVTALQKHTSILP